MLHHWHLPTSIAICLFLTSFVFTLMLICHYDIKSLLKLDKDPFGAIAFKAASTLNRKTLPNTTMKPASGGELQLTGELETNPTTAVIVASRESIEDDFGFMDEVSSSGGGGCEDDGDNDSAFSRENSILSGENLLYRTVELAK